MTPPTAGRRADVNDAVHAAGEERSAPAERDGHHRNGTSTRGRPTMTAIRIAAAVAVVFGLLTIVSGGRALFGGADMGAVVGFVLVFNFLAGFAYVAAGPGLWQGRRWAARLAFAILAATLVVFAAFGWHVLGGGAFEQRTVGAMILRTVVWAAITAVAFRATRR